MYNVTLSLTIPFDSRDVKPTGTNTNVEITSFCETPGYPTGENPFDLISEKSARKMTIYENY